MKNVTISTLKLRNFKKIQCLTIDFGSNTEILGQNGAGKSTIADAYLWLLSGKNQQEQTDFSIKTLDKDNNPIPKLDHEVEGTFIVDSQNITFKRVYREKWVTKRGNDFEELTGHETTYFVNDVPTSAGDYKNKVSDMIPDNISKIISNPLFFNTQLKWQDRREILSQMAGEITDNEVLTSISAPDVLKIISQGQSIEDQKKIIQVNKKRIKDELETIPARIDEANNSKPDVSEYNLDEIDTEIEANTKRVEKLQSEIEDSNKSIQSQRDKIAQLSTEQFRISSELNNLRHDQHRVSDSAHQELKSKISSKSSEIETAKSLLSNLNRSKDQSNSMIATLKADNERLKLQYNEWVAKQFTYDPNATTCPACKRELENAASQIDQLQASFNSNKLRSIEQIKATATDNNTEIATLNEKVNVDNEKIEKTTALISQLESELKQLQDLPKPSTEIVPTKEMISLQAELDAIIIPEIVAPDNSELKAQIEVYTKRNIALRDIIALVPQIERLNKRIEELKEQQRGLSQELANLEKVGFQIEQFEKAKIEMVENRTNSLFTLVKFKMFETQLNGGEAPACVCTVDGVPFSDLNTAMKINASLDIINALQHYFGVLAPVFIDQKESVTELIKTECQTICLKVDETAKKLTIITD